MDQVATQTLSVGYHSDLVGYRLPGKAGEGRVGASCSSRCRSAACSWRRCLTAPWSRCCRCKSGSRGGGEKRRRRRI